MEIIPLIQNSSLTLYMYIITEYLFRDKKAFEGVNAHESDKTSHAKAAHDNVKDKV